MHFKINLSLIAIVVIVLFFNIPFYNNWLNSNILNPSLSISEQSQHMGLEDRKVVRFGYSYIVYKELVKTMVAARTGNDVLLLPPEKYFKERGMNELSIAEPAVFYYFTGHNAVWTNSPNVYAATWVMDVDAARRLTIRKIGNRQDLDALLNKFKAYKPDL